MPTPIKQGANQPADRQNQNSHLPQGMSAIQSVTYLSVGLSNDNERENTATGTEHQSRGDNKQVMINDVQRELIRFKKSNNE